MWKKWFRRNRQSQDVPLHYDRLDPDKLPKHIAIIMDGNGRWAKKRGLPRAFGHRAGVEALRGIVSAAAEIGIGVLTTYAFSTENWKRPTDEVDLLMSLFSEYLDNEIAELHDNGVQIRFIGQIDGLSKVLQNKMDHAHKMTAANNGLILNIAVNYGGRAEIIRAVQTIARDVLASRLDPSEITEATLKQHLYTLDLPDPDLLIRPSGDLRISNFLLWQSAYAELWFTNTNWPDFTVEHLIEAILDYQKRERRFGGLITTK
ncbi:MAG: isoprenyl transferase [Negativicutes bacterium]|nr:isoprenyl transferase [Negativicutes bacterium]